MTDAPTDLASLRTQIDALDAEILDVINRRAALARTVGERFPTARTTTDDGARLVRFAPARERAILERLRDLNRGPLPSDAIDAIFHEIIGACRSVAAPLEVAVLGGPASFTHHAARERFGAGPVYQEARTITEVFDRVARRRATLGVVPVENNIEGAVSATLDALRTTDLEIIGELDREVTHHLLVAERGPLADIKAVYSHPQALGQCRQWLDENLPDAARVETTSTADGARIAAERDGTAAIASELAAGLFALQIAVRRIEDQPGNRTRFLIIGRGAVPPVAGARHRTSLIFACADRPGALHLALGAFTDASVNLTKLQSRPARDAPWDYIFFADLDGHRDDDDVHRALDVLTARAARVKVLGSYPIGPATAGSAPCDDE